MFYIWRFGGNCAERVEACATERLVMRQMTVCRLGLMNVVTRVLEQSTRAFCLRIIAEMYPNTRIQQQRLFSSSDAVFDFDL